MSQSKSSLTRMEEELVNLSELIAKMSSLVEHHLTISLDAFVNFDASKPPLVIDDNPINALEREIETICINFLVRERPYARDLRFVGGILQVVSDLERLGDHAEDIAYVSRQMKTKERHNIPALNEMIAIAMEMVRDAIDSLIRKDQQLAEDVIKRDDIVDRMFQELLDYLIEENDNETYSSNFTIYATLIVKYIERIADHAVNAAEWAVYIISGFHKDKQI
ncbi:MAG: phosphate signaling complex protein PhoU [Erysipelotrichaceae bacterium]|nr:phosphate signaling complex protein PhoU [Erysipelotrichaceae bacterium]